MKKRLLIVPILGAFLAGCANKYVAPANTGNLTQLSLQAEGGGASLAGIQIRFWHVDNAGKCDMWKIEGDRTLMHTIEIGGFSMFGDEQPKTLPIVAGNKSHFLVTATSGSLMCGVMSDFVPKEDESYILKFDGVLKALSNSQCSVELTTSDHNPVESLNSQLCFKPH
ncbi:hypothetical protein [Vibrio tasmaniensis]|uniref:hypothetical protein n=1 Tax=Vibrio tasmaniensis TaxID=212663 RepID=UPI00111B4B16|nr:hypothetical protein [Vibrio tasmaniensis]